MTPEELRDRVLYDDDDVIVIDKPPGLAVHAAGIITDHLDLYLPWLARDGERVPGLAHRLDRDTSGCLVLGRHDRALKRLGVLFAGGEIAKTYWAVTEGVPAEPDGIIDLPLLKLPRRGGFSIVVDPAGKPATSRYRVLGEGDGLAWLELEPLTGRTHQLRIHCAAIGCPIVGEPFYGAVKGASGEGRLHLLSRHISFQLAKATPSVSVSAAPPSMMVDALSRLGWSAEAYPHGCACGSPPPSDRPAPRPG